MIYIESSSHDAAYNFSIEDYLLHHAELTCPIVMLWQTKPCVMIGQYQIADLEVDKVRAKEKNVAIVRRPSGGGAIYTDEGTFLLSLILPAGVSEIGAADILPQNQARTRFIDLLIGALTEMGIPAQLEGRNDILLAGKKISGMAQHVKAGKSCTHASLLFDADLESLASLLRVDDEKFRTKAVKSIRSRVTNIKDSASSGDVALGSTAEEFACTFKSVLLAMTNAKLHTFTPAEGAQIEQIYQEKYGNSAWTYTKTPKFSTHTTRRFPGGKVEVFLEIVKGRVDACAIHGDFLGTTPITSLEKKLIGLEYSPRCFEKALDQIALTPYLGDITAEELLSCVFD